MRPTDPIELTEITALEGHFKFTAPTTQCVAVHSFEIFEPIADSLANLCRKRFQIPHPAAGE
jgi:hypothetical protein